MKSDSNILAQAAHRDNATSDKVLSAQLLTIDDFARRLKCSTRHIRRLVDAGRAPSPIHLGALLRFDSAVIDQWIIAGCPDLRREGRGR